LGFIEDGPEHAEQRKILTSFFTDKRVKDSEQIVQDITNKLFDKVANKPSINLLQDFATQLPIYVVAHLLGFPPEDIQKSEVG